MKMKSKNPLILYSFFLLIMITIFGCSSASKTEKAQIIPAENTVWNEIDSEIITDSLITISLHSEWNKNFSKKRKPIIVVGKIEDRSNENIDVSLLAKNLERSLINSGMPGDNVKMDVTLIAPIAMEDGLRFAIREGGRTVGAGVVSKITE